MESNEQKHESKEYAGLDIRDIILGSILALLMAFVIRLCVTEIMRVPSASMEPTILQGDVVLVSKLMYSIGASGSILGYELPASLRFWFSDPKKNDIVVFYPPIESKESQVLFVKRIIAGPKDINPRTGDTIPYKGMQLDANSIMAQVLRYKNDPGTEQNQTYTVGANYFYVAGDNKEHSYDSKDWGFVNQESIIGKAIAVCWSIDAQTSTIRWNRFGTICQ